ncbi:hypothetical protein RQP46_009772 [Phenoliferia psychrophenolica]
MKPKGAVIDMKNTRDQLAQGIAPLEEDYTVPMLSSDWKPTVEFADSILPRFKDGKVMQRRLAWQIVPEGDTINAIRDTHGQYCDTLHLLTLIGKPSAMHALLSAGDFVYRGSWSTEWSTEIVLVLSYKWLYPKKVFLNRGNHETADMNKVYGFEGRKKKKYSELTYKLFEEVFTAQPDIAQRHEALLRRTLSEEAAVIRSHEVRQGGFSVEHNDLLITVFLSPNYVDQAGNLAAFATNDATGEMKFTTLSEQPRPPMQADGQRPDN